MIDYLETLGVISSFLGHTQTYPFISLFGVCYTKIELLERVVDNTLVLGSEQDGSAFLRCTRLVPCLVPMLGGEVATF